MSKLIVLLLLIMAGNNIVWSDEFYQGLQVEVKRNGRVFSINASFDTTLTTCAAYHYLTDYEVKKQMPGVIELLVFRQSPNKVRVELTADEPISFFSVRNKSVLEYTENPFEGIAFKQLSGSSKSFEGNWHIEPIQQGHKLRYKGLWEPDTSIPLMIFDQFAKKILIKKFSVSARLAENYKDTQTSECLN